jgi:hypothetical protein
MSDFGIFWAVYPRHVAKKDAEKAWKKLTSEQKVAAMDALPKHIERWSDPEFIPYPATWLNGCRWEDELERQKPKLAPVERAWWTSNEGVERKARELGLQARAGEGWAQFKARVMAADKQRAA